MNDHDEILGKAFDLRLMRRLMRFLSPYKRFFLICIANSSPQAGIYHHLWGLQQAERRVNPE